MSGIVSYQTLKQLVEKKNILSEFLINDSQFQPNTLDLRLGKKAYRLKTTFLAVGTTVIEKINDLKMYELDLSNGAILEKNCVYIIPLQESLNLPDNMGGKTNPKSSTGRLDIFTRVITDYNFRYNTIEKGYTGNLYVEVSPISFTIKVKEGDCLNQIRLIDGENSTLSEKELKDYYSNSPLLYRESGAPIPFGDVVFNNGLYMSIDLEYKNNNRIIGYKSKKNTAVVELSKKYGHDKSLFWEEIRADESSSLILEPEEFYIFASKEKIVIPPGLCGEMIPYDPENGEMRVHYAGFFDTGFGYVKGNSPFKGAKAVLEIRPHDVPFLIEDGQILFRMVFSRNSIIPEQIYGDDMGSNYQCQGLSLSKHFSTKGVNNA